ncbi:hypothetical protein R1sor_015601 [Riccia sorocarpa]|uniref:Rubredoxin family protein n=1 Tax=Riccia sorocarpa TaxID=122646 RepID=A0ABD3HFQ8_9MARC
MRYGAWCCQPPRPSRSNDLHEMRAEPHTREHTPVFPSTRSLARCREKRLCTVVGQFACSNSSSRSVGLCQFSRPSASNGTTMAVVVAGLPSGITCVKNARSSELAAISSSSSKLQLQSSFLGKGLPGIGVRAVSTSRNSQSQTSVLQIRAKTAGASKTFETEVDKPLGLTLGAKAGGGVVVTGVEGGGNAARAGIKVGDQVVYTSSFFGDELWPADNLGFTTTAIRAKPDSVYLVLSRGGDVNVKRLPKRPAPSRFGRKLTDAQKVRATHVCLDCGYIYTLSKSFDDQPESYECPQCQAPKKRFARYDPETGRAIGGGGTPISVILGVLAGAIAVGALAFYGLQ